MIINATNYLHRISCSYESEKSYYLSFTTMSLTYFRYMYFNLVDYTDKLI